MKRTKKKRTKKGSCFQRNARRVDIRSLLLLTAAVVGSME